MINTKTLTDSTFLDKHGCIESVKNVVNQDECWFLKREARWVLTHKAIQRIADKAGISKNFDVEESKTIVPTYQNELEHIIRVTIHCKAHDGLYTDKCVHSDESKLTVTGEANRLNTPNRGREYLRKMAEKRAFDIAVLEHLNLYSSTFSEEEAEKFEQKEKEPELMPGTKAFEDVSPTITRILNAITRAELIVVSREIKKDKKENKFTDLQLDFIRKLYNRELNKKTPTF